MQRGWLLATALVAVAACGSDQHHLPDARLVDGKVVDGQVSPDAAGSGSAVASILDPSPRDHGLEMVVVVTSMVLVIGPVRGSRRRRDDDATPGT